MNIAIILAGGVGSRMRSDGLPKQYVDVGGKPVLIYTLEKFENCPSVDRIIVVANEQWKEDILCWADTYGITKLCAIAEPGDTRQESVLSGLLACETYLSDEDDMVLIHDAARPLVTCELINACVEAGKDHDACLPVIPMKDTVYCSTNGNSVTGLTDRSTLFCGQSPEAFKFLKYLQLNKNTPTAQLKAIRGSCELAYANGLDICMIPGEEMNFKLTTKEDMDRLHKVLGYSESN